MGEKPAQREPSSELLGPYALLTEIARGQLTTVHLARKHGALGFQRLMAIKRLTSPHARDPACMRLLLDEARVTAGLHHANLVNVLDVGSEGGCYVVSDYIEGDSLEGLLARGAERHPRYVIPVIVDALNGLHAVHTALDEHDTPYAMVHQAPHARHILVGTDGTARVTDFSQVRARGLEPNPLRAKRLRTGYLAPELVIDPERADHRSDLFIVGIVLWEALTGEPLFQSDPEELTFQNLLHRRIPRPSEVGLRPPRCFDAVCMRALDRDLTGRYETALEMARELRDVALNQALYATAGEIGRWVKNACRAELSERRRRVGVELVSTETPIRGSGMFRMPSGPSDPYGSGLIYGGSQSMVKRDDGTPQDFDKTPALGMRGQPGRARLREDEPTAPHPLVPRHTMNDGPTEPSPQGRTRTLPYGTPAVSLPEGLFSDPNPRSAPADDKADAENTSPAVFVPARPGARRDSSIPSPGAYSQVSPERRARTSRPTPAPQSAPSGAFSGGPAFEELATSQFASLPPAKPAAPRRAGAVVEEPPQIISRQDSVPVRRSIPEGPVGSPLTPVPSAPDAPAKARAELAPETPADEPVWPFERAPDVGEQVKRAPSDPPASSHGHRTQLGFAAEPVTSPVAPTTAPSSLGAVWDWEPAQPQERAMLLPPGAPSAHEFVKQPFDLAPPLAPELGSLTPPNSAAHTLPPALLEDPRRRNLGVWVVSGALAAIIVLALVVGARRWSDEHPPRAAAASSAPADGVEADDLLNADVSAEGEPPSPVNPAGGVPKVEDEARAEPGQAPEARPRGPKLAPRAAKAPVPATKAAAPKPAAPVVPVAKPKAKSAIPDNPY